MNVIYGSNKEPFRQNWALAAGLIPGHSRLNSSQLLDYCHATISSGKACHSRAGSLSAPFVLGRCPGSDTRWRLHPSGSARGRREPARSSRPATTKATWRSVEPERRWVLSRCVCHVCLGCVSLRARDTPADLPVPGAVNFLIVLAWARHDWTRRTSAHRGISRVLRPRFLGRI